jgi:hypothetical protein
MAVTEGQEPAPGVVDAGQSTAMPSFDSWLQDFDRLSIPDGFGRSLASWAYKGYQDLPHGISRQMRKGILYVFYLFLIPLSRKGFSSTPSVDELAKDALRRTQETATAPEQTGPKESHELQAAVDISDEQAHLFLTHLEGSVRAAAESAEKDAEIMRDREQVLFRMFLIAAAVTFIFAAVGVVLIFTGSLAVGILSAAIAIFPGSGTAILRGMARQQQVARAAKSAAADDDRHVWQAVQAAMMIPDPHKRNAAMVQLAERFASRISG